MYLGPHHLQVQSRYFEDSLYFATGALWFSAYGFVGYQLDAEALQNGTVSLVHARGVFPDGLAFHLPDSDPPPAPRAIGDLFPPARDSVTVLLTIPERRPNGLNCLPAEAVQENQVRYMAETTTRADETTGRDEKPVRLGRKNLQLMLDTEPLEGLTVLPLARVRRDGKGHFLFDPQFVPPLLQIGASEPLLGLLRRLLEILDDKSSSIAAGRQGRSLTEYSTRDIASFWLLHAVNSALVPLRHLYVTKRGHPEELYRELARLGGALCSFALDSHPRSLPLYDHEALGDCLHALDLHIRTHLETIIPTNCVSIPLRKTADYFYEGDVADARCLGRSRWILAVRSGIGEVEVIARTPQLVKVCSLAFVPELVKRALPGMALTHLQVPPSAIAVQHETQYFAIDRVGPCWDHLAKTKRVGVYAPGELGDPQLELFVVLEQ